jgi:hypothetical protein
LGYVPLIVAIIAAVTLIGDDAPTGPITVAARLATIRTAQVWSPTTIPSLDLRRGPTESDAFEPGQLVPCLFVPKSFAGSSPKFACAIDASDQVKVKYGRDNGEVYAEVAASRLLWVLGFGADRMYPVRVRCRGCTTDAAGLPTRREDVEFDRAVIERRFPGEEITTGPEEGWSWSELDLVDERAGGAPRAHRDALKLLAAFLQHTDSKPEQQRFVCLSPIDQAASRGPDKVRATHGPDTVRATHGPVCAKPFLYVQDLGKTFGRADYLNRDVTASVNVREWEAVPVWADPTRCVARLDASVTGTLHNPRISEAGRAFLAGLLNQLSDAQLHDLFDVARVNLRTVDEASPVSVEEWVTAFKDKRAQIDAVRCED